MPDTDPEEIRLSTTQFYAVAAIIGTALALIGGFGAIGYFKLHDTQDKLRQILNPTPREFRQQYRRGVRICIRDPECRKLFPQLQKRPSKKTARRQHESERNAVARKRRQHARTRGSTPKRDAARENGSQRARPKRTKRPVARKPRPRPRPQPSKPIGQAPSPPPSNPPPPSPPVEVQTHLPPPLPNPQICDTPGHAADVNC